MIRQERNALIALIVFLVIYIILGFIMTMSPLVSLLAYVAMLGLFFSFLAWIYFVQLFSVASVGMRSFLWITAIVLVLVFIPLPPLLSGYISVKSAGLAISLGTFYFVLVIALIAFVVALILVKRQAFTDKEGEEVMEIAKKYLDDIRVKRNEISAAIAAKREEIANSMKLDNDPHHTSRSTAKSVGGPAGEEVYMVSPPESVLTGSQVSHRSRYTQ